MGDLEELAAIEAVGPGQGQGGSAELEKVAAGELVRAREDGGSGGERGRGRPSWARVRRSFGKP